MSVYHDMANDAGCPYGTDENEQMAQSIEAEHERQMQEAEGEVFNPNRIYIGDKVF